MAGRIRRWIPRRRNGREKRKPVTLGPLLSLPAYHIHAWNVHHEGMMMMMMAVGSETRSLLESHMIEKEKWEKH